MEPFIKGFAQDAPEPTVPPSEYLTVEEVAHLLRLSESAIYRALREHRLPGLKILGRWRIPRAELAEQNGRGGATPARGETDPMRPVRRRPRGDTFRSKVVELRRGPER